VKQQTTKEEEQIGANFGFQITAWKIASESRERESYL
jgi:hypothetical protein